MGRLITLEEYILKSQNRFPGAKGELSQLLRDISLASKIISKEVNRAGLAQILGTAGSMNVHGESVKRLDLFANDQLIRALSRSGSVCMIVSEESEGVIRLRQSSAKYIVFMDPLDGSSNVDVNVSIGTIFSVFQRISHEGDEPGDMDLLQPGTRQIAAGYVLFGTNTKLLYTTGMGVTEFTLEPSIGEFFLSEEQIRIPVKGDILSVNEGNRRSWSPELNAYWNHIKSESPLTTRYIGSMVSDVHRTLISGGIFLYPESVKLPDGKLRLMYEGNPMAFLMEQAGGVASTGSMRIMDIVPTDIHQRVPVYMGSPANMTQLLGFLKTR
jgi:fructose-1,6-bisphosphatase I